MSPLVDTLQATRQLENAGFGSAQAEAIVTIVAHAGTRLATKDDIERLEAATKKDIEGLRTELTARMDAKIAEVRTEIAEVRAEMAEVRQEISALRAELTDMMNRQANKHLMVMVAALGLLFVALRFT